MWVSCFRTDSKCSGSCFHYFFIFKKSRIASFHPSLQPFLLFSAAFHCCLRAFLWVSAIFQNCLKAFRQLFSLLYFQKSCSASFHPSLQSFLLLCAAFHCCLGAFLWVSAIFQNCLKSCRQLFSLLYFLKSCSSSLHPSLLFFLLFSATFHCCLWAFLFVSVMLQNCRKVLRQLSSLLYLKNSCSASFHPSQLSFLLFSATFHCCVGAFLCFCAMFQNCLKVFRQLSLLLYFQKVVVPHFTPVYNLFCYLVPRFTVVSKPSCELVQCFRTVSKPSGNGFYYFTFKTVVVPHLTPVNNPFLLFSAVFHCCLQAFLYVGFMFQNCLKVLKQLFSLFHFQKKSYCLILTQSTNLFVI